MINEFTSTQSSSSTSTGPLNGITVLDLTRVLSGPYCTMMLADMGARVIKIEQPKRGDDTRTWGPPFQNGESAYFLSVNRNKESVTLDFKHPKGRQLLESLIEKSDVFVENFRPGTLDRQQLGFSDLAGRFPSLIYCSVSAFGQTGPRRTQPGYDAVMQGEGGLMSITGSADGPPCRVGIAISDIVSGMFAAYGIAMALFARQSSGAGQLVDVGMLDSVAALLSYQAGIYFATGEAPKRLGNCHPTIVPYETFETADGQIVIAVGNEELWDRFCTVLKREDLKIDPRFRTNRDRVASQTELRQILANILHKHQSQFWIDGLTEAGVPCGVVKNLDQVFADPQISARDMVVSLMHPAAGSINVLGVPIKLSHSAGSVRTPPPLIGEHTEKVLSKDLKLDHDEIDRLRQEGVI